MPTLVFEWSRIQPALHLYDDMTIHTKFSLLLVPQKIGSSKSWTKICHCFLKPLCSTGHYLKPLCNDHRSIGYVKHPYSDLNDPTRGPPKVYLNARPARLGESKKTRYKSAIKDHFYVITNILNKPVGSKRRDRKALLMPSDCTHTHLTTGARHCQATWHMTYLPMGPECLFGFKLS